jgi:hypothetical protein
MNDADRWIYFDGPAPEHIRPLLDAVRAPPPATPEDEDKEQAVQRFLARLDAALPRSEEPAGGEETQGSDAPGALIAPIAPIAPIAAPNAERRGNKYDVTVRSPTLDDRGDASPPEEPSAPKAPFEAQGPRAADTGAAPAARRQRAPEHLVTASLSLDIPAEVRALFGKLPSKPASPGPALATTMKVPDKLPSKPASPGPALATTMKVPTMSARHHAETAPIGDDSIAKAVAALPFVGNTVGAAIVPLPRLKLEEYALLRAELAVWPERAGEILLRYHVPSEAVRRALEEHWAERLRGNVEERAAFERAVGEYSAWLRGRRG